ncbi:GNAT family N-acetyltransferase [Chlorobaculum tepidum]|uniref:GNAT family N-acetyltransferase n=1 Tax=Chlorobaculum tepidum TaxID=1097 RepID=UPI00389963AA
MGILKDKPFIIEALRAAGALTISLVAALGGRVVGHIAFSPVTMSDGSFGGFGLGLLSVLPEFQRQGIGGVLIRDGLAWLKALGAIGCCLVGHPEYYRQFGFENPDGLGHEGVPLEFFFVLSFGGQVPQGSARFHDAFMASGPAS